MSAPRESKTRSYAMALRILAVLAFVGLIIVGYWPLFRGAGDDYHDRRVRELSKKTLPELLDLFRSGNEI